MKRLIAAFLLSIFSSLVFGATFVYTKSNSEFVITGHDRPCVANIPVELLIVAAMQGIDVGKLQQAEVVGKGEVRPACWLQVEGENVNRIFIMDERGSFGTIDLGEGV